MDVSKIDSLTESFSNLLGLVSVVLIIYGYLLQTQWKIPVIAIGIILIYFYTRGWIKDFIAKDILVQNEKINKLEKEYRTLKEDVIYMKGWKEAINHFKSKKGARGIDPLTLIVITIVIILFIAFIQGYFQLR